MGESEKLQRSRYSQSMDQLLEEFQKKSPDQRKIKSLFEKCDLTYSIDPIDQMMTVLSYCDVKPFKKRNPEMEPS